MITSNDYAAAVSKQCNNSDLITEIKSLQIMYTNNKRDMINIILDKDHSQYLKLCILISYHFS
jgi:hypothetical protein